MPEPFILAAIAGAFLIAGTVKGVIGFGLPIVSLALMTLVLDLPAAMALLLAPSFLTNLWQAFAGANGREILARIWPFLCFAAATVWVGALALTRVDLALLSALLGALLVVYGVISLAGLSFRLSARSQAWAGPLFGAVNGVIAGMTGVFVVPGAIYLQAVGLERDRLVQALGMLFLVSTVALGAALGGNKLLDAKLGGLSLFAIAPAALGMAFGQRIRRRLPEARFRHIFFAALMLLGAAIIAKGAFAGGSG